MKAAVLRNIGDENLDIVDNITAIEPGEGEVSVKIEATGVCHSDLSGMKGIIPQPAPFIPGHEGAGVVTAVGDGVTNVVEGDHVIVAWSPPCGICAYCTGRNQPNLCSAVQMTAMGVPRFRDGDTPVFGFAGAGTFAEEIVLVKEAVVPIDKSVPLEIASLVGCGVMTGVGAAINTAKVEPGSSAIVYGCGGVGISAIQGCNIAGASEIIAVDLVESKLKEAMRFGATHAVKPDEVDALKMELTGGDGFDYAFEAIGLPVTMRAAYDAVRRGGTACIIGVGGFDQIVEFNAFELFYGEKNFVGSYYGGADVRTDFNRLLKLWKAGKLDLDRMISSRIKIEDVNEALRLMERGEVVRQVITF